MVLPRTVSPYRRSIRPSAVWDAEPTNAILLSGATRTVASYRVGVMRVSPSVKSEALSIRVSNEPRAEGAKERRPPDARMRSAALTRNGPYVSPPVRRYWLTNIVESGVTVPESPADGLAVARNAFDWRGESL